jgi:hypothetical protein
MVVEVVVVVVDGLIKLTEKHDKNHETDDKAHTPTQRMYTPMYSNVLNPSK